MNYIAPTTEEHEKREKLTTFLCDTPWHPPTGTMLETKKTNSAKQYQEHSCHQLNQEIRYVPQDQPYYRTQSSRSQCSKRIFGWKPHPTEGQLAQKKKQKAGKTLRRLSTEPILLTRITLSSVRETSKAHQNFFPVLPIMYCWTTKHMLTGSYDEESPK